MLLSPVSGPTVTRLRPGSGTDSYGDPVESWDAPARFALKGATVQDVSVIEDEGTVRHIIRGQKTLYIPGAADLTAADRVEIDGEVWRVDGPPKIRAGLASAVYTTAALTLVTIG